MIKGISRKQFIIQSGSAVAMTAFGFPNIILPNRKKKLGVALVGLGNYSTHLLAPGLQLTKHCELRGIVTGSPEKIPVWQERYSIPDRNVYNYETMHQVAANDDIDIIYVVTPPSLHATYSIIGAEAGKHVWCEKPMARTVEECEAIIAAAAKNRVQLTIGYRMQHEPNTQTIIRYGREQTYGSIKQAKSGAGYRAYVPEDDWRLRLAMGGGALYDMGVYPINAVRHAIGAEPVSIRGEQITERTDLFVDADEYTVLEMEFPGGVYAKCETSMGDSINYLDIECTDGDYYLRPFQAYSGVRGETSSGTVLEPFEGHQQALQMDNDALAIKENSPPLVPGEDGLADIRIVKSVMESSAADGRWLRL